MIFRTSTRRDRVSPVFHQMVPSSTLLPPHLVPSLTGFPTLLLCPSPRPSASPTDLQSTLSKRPSIKLPKVRPRRVSATPSTHPLNTTSSPASSAAATGDLDPIPGSAVSETGPILGARVD